MRAMVFEGAGTPLREAELEQPVPGPGEVRLRVRGCGVCRTDLHIVDGELAEPKLPLVLGHQIVAMVAERGPDANRFQGGELGGVPGLGWTWGGCRYCRSGRENLCANGRFPGYRIDAASAEGRAAAGRCAFP